MTEPEALIALNMLPRLGPVRIGRLLERFGSAPAVLGAPAARTQAVNGIGPELARILHRWEDHADLAGELRRIRTRGLQLLTAEDADWPEAFRHMPDAPVVLYVWGRLAARDRHAFAIVGSRRATNYGRTCARKFSFQLAHAGFTIISGLARGIDTAAHEGALAARGRTVAVLGSGLGQLYPPENMPLAERIAEGSGAVVSEFPIDTPPDQQTFPQRNRIVAGWCEGLMVVECPRKSGAIITANLAGEYGRHVFAIPGPIDQPQSEGCHALIRTGATLVTDGAQVLDELSQLPLEARSDPPLAQPAGPAAETHLSDAEQAILAQLGSRERNIDELVTAAGLPASVVATTLLRLEMKSLVKQLPGSYFVRES